MIWPNNKSFALTIIDDTDFATREHKGFLSLLRVIEPFIEMFPGENQHRGGPSYGVLAFLPAALRKRYFKIVATSELRSRLLSDANL
jgi:hypothetical protein